MNRRIGKRIGGETKFPQFAPQNWWLMDEAMKYDDGRYWEDIWYPNPDNKYKTNRQGNKRFKSGRLEDTLIQDKDYQYMQDGGRIDYSKLHKVDLGKGQFVWRDKDENDIVNGVAQKKSSSVKPIITNDLNDLRLRAYQDSLLLYNSTNNYNKTNLDIPYKKAVAAQNRLRTLNNGNLETVNGNFVKPVQPVVYQAKQERKIGSSPSKREQEAMLKAGENKMITSPDNPNERMSFEYVKYPKKKPIPQPQIRQAIPHFGYEQRPYDSIMMPSGQKITKDSFIKQYGEKTWNDKYGKIDNDMRTRNYAMGGRIKPPKYTVGGAFSGALSGASMGASFGPWGAAAGGALGLVGGILGSNEEEKRRKEEEAKQEQARQEMMAEMKRQTDAISLSNYPTRGITGQFYKMGGRLKYHAYGGNLKPLSSSSSKVIGDTHSQDSNRDGSTGVILSDNQGQPMAEVENQEVIDQDRVYSSRLGTAQTAESLAMAKGKLEKKLSSTTDRHTRGTLEREIEKIDKQLSDLFTYQESFKEASGIENPVKENIPVEQAFYGTALRTTTTPKKNPFKNTDWGQVTNQVGAFIDNFANSSLLANTPAIPKPVLMKAPNLNTTHNVAGQLGSVNRATRARITDIDANTSNSNVARANKQAAISDQMYAENQIFENQTNQETALRDKDTLNKQGILVGNTGLANQYNTDTFNRAINIRDQRSKNYTNLSEDFRFAGQDASNRKLDYQKFLITAKQNPEVFDNFTDTELAQKASTPEAAQAMYDALIGNPTTKPRAENLRRFFESQGISINITPK